MHGLPIGVFGDVGVRMGDGLFIMNYPAYRVLSWPASKRKLKCCPLMSVVERGSETIDTYLTFIIVAMTKSNGGP